MRKEFIFLSILFFLTTGYQSFAQVRDTTVKKGDSLVHTQENKKDTVPVLKKDSFPKALKKDSLKQVNRADSILHPERQVLNPPDNRDTNLVQRDNRQPPRATVPPAPLQNIEVETLPVDTLPSFFLPDSGTMTGRFLKSNRFINVSEPSVNFVIERRESSGKEFLFYFICGLLLYVGLFRTIYPGYFANLFRVYFNTSLRQTQLAEQLLQAKLPSFLLNLFFVLSAGTFIWQLLEHFHQPLMPVRKLLPLCITFVAIIYLIKFFFLKFIGWASTIQGATDNYIFIIFMVNKILGIVWLPFIIILAFAPEDWKYPAALTALLTTGLFFLSRYIKGYALARQKISINSFHFLLYILAAEVFPLMILYKAGIDYLL